MSYLPAVRPAGAVTTNAADVLSPALVNVNGASAGVAVHPCGSRSRNVPLTGWDDELIARTTIPFWTDPEPVGTINNRLLTPTVSAGTTSTSRRSSPRIRSPTRYCTGRVTLSGTPAISNDATPVRSGGANGN